MFRPLAAACILALTVLAGCAQGRPSDARIDGLLLLAGDTSDTDLRAWTGQDAGSPIDIPDGTTWVSAGRADVLAVGLADGTLRLSDPIRPDRDPTWESTKATLSTGDEAVAPFAFPVWDPDGGRIATVAGDFDADPRPDAHRSVGGDRGGGRAGPTRRPRAAGLGRTQTSSPS